MTHKRNRAGDESKGGKGRGRSEAMLFSLTEFAFVLLFLCIAGLGVLYAAYDAGNRQAHLMRARVDTLETEVVFLQELLDEKQYGVVPCWRRPEQKVAPLIGSVRILGPNAYTVEHRSGVARDSLPEELIPNVLELFAPDIRYASEMNCYLRVAVDNTTNSFAYYRRVADELRNHGLVVVNE